jgi:hypothetical protein
VGLGVVAGDEPGRGVRVPFTEADRARVGGWARRSGTALVCGGTGSSH